jgi:hypothetical protein
VPGLHRIRKLRRRIGADERPFSPLLKRPRHHARFHRIVAPIQAEEARLVSYLGSVNRDLERRIRVRRARGEW